MPAIIAVACCVIIPAVVVAIMGMVRVIDEARKASDAIPLPKRIWKLLIKS